MNADTKNLFTKAHQAGTFDNIRTTNCFQAPWVFQERKCGLDLLSLSMCRDFAKPAKAKDHWYDHAWRADVYFSAPSICNVFLFAFLLLDFCLSLNISISILS